MTFIERIEDLLFWIFSAIVSSVAGGTFWLIRRIFTNQKQIELLQASLQSQQISRDQQRVEDRERMSKVEAGVERIEGILMKSERGGK